MGIMVSSGNSQNYAGASSYVLAWDGASTPVVANIPAGVTVTYDGNSYTGTMTASANGFNKIYLVSTGVTDNYERYVVSKSGSTYSWSDVGSTEMELEDFVELQYEVSALGQEVDEIFGIIDFPTIANSCINASGVITGLSGATRSDYIDVSGISYIYATNPNNSDLEYNVFYDSSKVFVSGSRFTIPANAVYYKIAVPAGASYCIVSARNNGLVPELYSDGVLIDLDNAKKDIVNLQADDAEIHTMLGIVPLTIISGSGINAAGAISSITGAQRSDYFEVKGDAIFVNNPNNSVADYNAFYDSSKTFISRFPITANAVLQRVPIPTLAKYCILSVRNNGLMTSAYMGGVAPLAMEAGPVPHLDYAVRYGEYRLNGNFVHGNISAFGSVSYSDTYKYQVISDKMFYAEKDLVIYIKNGYKAKFFFYSSATMTSTYFISSTNNQNGSYTISAGSYWTLIINTDPTSAGETDINTLANAIYTKIPVQMEDIIAEVGDEFDLESLPDYWASELDSVMPDIVEKDALIGNAGDSFVFITDIHIPRNSMHSPLIIKRILEATSVDKVFCGGDLLDLDTGDDGKTTAISRYSLWNKKMYGIDDFFIMGNHDKNNYNSTNAANELTKAEVYGLIDKRLEKFYDLAGSTSYVIDNESQKMRYIVLDCESTGFADALTWMQGKLTELQSGWKAIIMQHRYWGTNTSTVSTEGTQLVTAINAVFGSLNCEIVAVIVGHTHTDYDIVEPTNGYPIIAVNCDARENSISGYDRTNGTTNEHSFDVFHIDYTNRKIYATRIGAGSDREFDY